MYNYIYILLKYEHKNDNIRKIGCTNNLSRRKQEYATGNLNLPIYDGYFKIHQKYNIFKVEKTIHRDLEFIKIYNGGGREFFQFKKNPQQTIKNILLNYKIEAELVSIDDIISHKDYTRKEEDEYYKFHKNRKSNKDNPYPSIFKEDKPKQLRYYQQKTLSIMKKNTFGKLILPTGSGKTIIFLEYLFNKIGLSLIIVPSIILVEQTYKKAIEKGFKNVYKIYSKSKDTIDFSKQEKEPVLIITTYQSSSKQTNKLLEYNYETIIFDECHRTSLNTISTEVKCFQKFLNHKKTKEKFFFTATEKNVNAIDLKEDEFISSMSNDELYGKELFRYSFSTAIKEGYLSDYNIDIIISLNKENSLINYLSKKKGYKTLIYCSSCDKSKNIKNILNKNNIKNIFYLDSKSKNKKSILNKFENNTNISVLILCKMCIVGYDYPQIDNIIHYDITRSTIELSQKNGRALRLFRGKQRAIFTFFVSQNNESEEESIKKCMIEMIKNDSRLEIEAKRIKEKKNKKQIHSITISVEGDRNIDESNSCSKTYDRFVNLISYNNSKLSYLEVKDIIKEYNIKTKENYFRITKDDFRLPKNPEEDFKGKFNWIDYFSINKKDYFTLDVCKKKSIEYLEKYPDLKKDYLLNPCKITKALSNINIKFPPYDLWCEFYNILDVKKVLKMKKKKKALSDY